MLDIKYNDLTVETFFYGENLPPMYICRYVLDVVVENGKQRVYLSPAIYKNDLKKIPYDFLFEDLVANCEVVKSPTYQYFKKNITSKDGKVIGMSFYEPRYNGKSYDIIFKTNPPPVIEEYDITEIESDEAEPIE